MNQTINNEYGKGYKALSLICTLGYFGSIVYFVFAVGVITKNLMGGTLMIFGAVFSGLLIYVFSKIGIAVFLIRDELANKKKQTE